MLHSTVSEPRHSKSRKTSPVLCPTLEALEDRILLTLPRIIANNMPATFGPGLLDSVQVTFDEPIDPATFTPDKIASFDREVGGAKTDLGPTLTAVTAVAGSNNTIFNIGFAATGTTGRYRMVIGPDIRDLSGNEMDQNNNGIPGEVPGDQYALNFNIAGPEITVAQPQNASTPIYSVTVGFNEPMDPTSCTADKVTLTGPMGTIPVSVVVPVPGSNFTQFAIVFPPTTTTGHYTLVLEPDIQDLYGNQLDQNGNFIPGEAPGDQFSVPFSTPGPNVLFSSPAGNNVPAVDHVRLTFDTPMDPSSFTPDKVASFVGPSGQNIPVTGVSVVPFTNNTQFDVTFASLGTDGTYTMVVGPDIRDIYGNAMDQNGDLIPGEASKDQYTATFTVNQAVQNIEDFETGGLSLYKVIDPINPTNKTPSAVASRAAAHDGSFGLADYDGNDWIYRDDPAGQVSQGEVLSVWVRFSAGVGRAYFGFGASNLGTLSVTLATDIGQIIIRSDPNFSFNDLATVNQSFLFNHFYRLEVTWAVGGDITARLFDSDGASLINKVKANYNGITKGGIAFRTVNMGTAWDTVTAVGGTGAGASYRSGNQASSLQSDIQGILLPTAAVQPTAASRPARSESPIETLASAALWEVLVIDGFFASTSQAMQGTGSNPPRLEEAGLALLRGEWQDPVLTGIFGDQGIPG